MPKIESFEKYSKEYDDWFIKNKDVYWAELNIIKRFIPVDGFGVEIGVGSGRFAVPLGIKIGVEPSRRMADISKNRGIQVYLAVAEQLPFYNKTFDFILMITTICFVDDVVQSFHEANRILKNHGFLVVGFVDKGSELGRRYQAKRKRSKFYRDATFYSVSEVIAGLKEAKFMDIEIKQTVFSGASEPIDTIENDYGNGSFVVIKAVKSNQLRS
jgi:SAM-dependent methyltransferase